MKIRKFGLRFLTGLCIAPIMLSSAGTMFSSLGPGNDPEEVLAISIDDYHKSVGLQSGKLSSLGNKLFDFSKAIYEGLEQLEKSYTSLRSAVEQAQLTSKGRLVRNQETGKLGGSSKSKFDALEQTIYGLSAEYVKLKAGVWGYRKKITHPRKEEKILLLQAIGDIGDMFDPEEGGIDVRLPSACYDWIFNPLFEDLAATNEGGDGEETVVFPQDSKTELYKAFYQVEEKLQEALIKVEAVEGFAKKWFDSGVRSTYLDENLGDIQAVWEKWATFGKEILELLKDIERAPQ